MERRFFLGIGLLILLLAASLAGAWGMRTVHSPAEQELERAAVLALENNWEQATMLAEQACRRWEASRKLTASLADHSPMDQVEQLIEELRVYAAAGELPHFAACCAQLRILMRAMYDAHSGTWWNFL